jgi:hypothetical protein
MLAHEIGEKVNIFLFLFLVGKVSIISLKYVRGKQPWSKT